VSDNESQPIELIQASRALKPHPILTALKDERTDYVLGARAVEQKRARKSVGVLDDDE